jgi:hypothetical protein
MLYEPTFDPPMGYEPIMKPVHVGPSYSSLGGYSGNGFTRPVVGFGIAEEIVWQGAVPGFV